MTILNSHLFFLKKQLALNCPIYGMREKLLPEGGYFKTSTQFILYGEASSEKAERG